MKLLTICLVIALLVMIAKTYVFSFRFQSPQDYAGSGPQFVLTEHLSGEILSEGVVFGPTGKMTSSFTARMVGKWEGDTGTLSEEFTFSNGATQSRKWHLELGSGNTFTATADDLDGVAQGVVSGSTVRLTYNIILPANSGGHTLQATDWLYLTANGVIINKSEMRKFGLKAAELVATMRPAD
ncbi:MULTISPECIES: DUF3833 family protein [unclassified Leisingera]|uniref:DUF3833 family protein n=1 Tax=unclassified Leisingera TaxID=2614906 RepID=UPI00057E6C81|nr:MULTISPECIES: DUF3833 family protein [unclassified Leisingera]KIC35107.1 hypothetical protein RA26_19285 [Leisingera sp. ANG-M7]MDC0659022.1 DUF3833 family protein [Leisingera sp. SS27]